MRRFCNGEVGNHPWPQRAEGVSPLGANPVTVRILQIAGSDVIGNGEPKDDFLSSVLWHVLTDPSDNDGQLPLVVQVGGRSRSHNGFVRADNRGIRLNK